MIEPLFLKSKVGPPPFSGPPPFYGPPLMLGPLYPKPAALTTKQSKTPVTNQQVLPKKKQTNK